jgi:hypothetical protein
MLRFFNTGNINIIANRKNYQSFDIMQFKIIGNPTKNKFWKWVNRIAQKKIKKTDDSIIDVKTVSFPSPYCILIRYEVINEGSKYEIVMQGNYVPQYKSWKEQEEPISGILDDREVEILIRSNHTSSKKVGS